jgi:hypothetical protein
MHPEIENLINMALADGDVTEKERAIILRKAQSLGLDLDEIEMILDGLIALNKKDQSISQVSSLNKSNKDGEVKKCPACGASAKSFVTICGDCGHEFRNTESSNTARNIVRQFEIAEEKMKNSKSGSGLVGGLMKMIDGDKMMEKRIYEAKSNIISTFPVPNTKEDILEILTLSVSQVNSIQIGTIDKWLGTSGDNGYKIIFKNAWLSLANKVIMKARFSMKEDRKTLNEIEYYANLLGIK